MYNEVVLPTVPGAEIKISSPAKSHRECYCRMHYHNEIELLQILEGSKECILQTRTETANAGDIIFINERVPHATKNYIGCTDRLIQFRIDNMSARYMMGVNYNMALFLSNVQTDCTVLKSGTEACCEINGIIEKMSAENEKGMQSYELFIKGYGNILMGMLYRYGILRPYLYSTEALMRISDIVRYVDNNYKKNISLDKLCTKFMINKSYFCRQFKKATNRTFTEYLNFVRILEAQRLLRGMDENITDISLECGFSEVSYFNRVFKSISGCTPKEFRKIKVGEQLK